MCRFRRVFLRRRLARRWNISAARSPLEVLALGGFERLRASPPSAPCLKNVRPAAASSLASGTANVSSGVSGGIGALGSTNAAAETRALRFDGLRFSDSSSLASASFAPPRTRTTLKKCVGTCTSSGASPRSGYHLPSGRRARRRGGRDVHERRFFDVFGPRAARRDGVPKLRAPRLSLAPISNREEQRAGGHEDVAAGFRVCGHELARELFQARPVVAVEPIADLGTHVQQREGVVHGALRVFMPGGGGEVAAIVPAAAVVAQLRGVRAVHLVVLHETRLLARPDAGAALRGDALEHPARSTRPRVPYGRGRTLRTRSRSSKPAGQPARIAGCATDAAPPASVVRSLSASPAPRRDSRAYAPTPPAAAPAQDSPRGRGRWPAPASPRAGTPETAAGEPPRARTPMRADHAFPAPGRSSGRASPPHARRRPRGGASPRIAARAACPPRSPAAPPACPAEEEIRPQGRTTRSTGVESSSGAPTFFHEEARTARADPRQFSCAALDRSRTPASSLSFFSWSSARAPSPPPPS